MSLKLFGRKSSPETCSASPGPGAAERYQAADEITLVEDQLKRALQLRRFGHIVARQGQWAGHPKAGLVAPT